MLDRPESLDPERTFANPEDKAVAAAVTVTAQVSNTRQIVIQTYVERDAPPAVYHEVLDKIGAAIGRQESKLDLETNRINLAQEEKTLRQLKEDFLAIEDRAQRAWVARGKKGPFKLSEQESASRRTAMQNIERYEDAIKKRKVDIEKLERQIAPPE